MDIDIKKKGYLSVAVNLKKEHWDKIKELGKKNERTGGAQLRLIVAEWLGTQAYTKKSVMKIK